MAANRTFIRGALVLAVAALVSKLLGSVYTVLLQNVIGDAGMGLYQMAYPIYSTLLILSTAGVPVAVSKFVSEYAALGQHRAARKVFLVSLVVLNAIGVVCAVLLFAAAGPLARASGDAQAVYAIQAIAPAFLIVPALSVMRGYFQGWQVMEPTAVSQVVEQIVRVITILAGAYLLLHLGFGQPAAAAAAAFGAVGGGAAGLCVMMLFMRRAELARKGQLPYTTGREPVPATRAVLGRLLHYAIPVSLGALIVPLTGNVDALTVANLLKAHGLAQTLATRDYGLLSGRAGKLMMFPAALAGSIGAAMLPSVSEASALRDDSGTAGRVLLGLRLMALFAMPAAAGMILLARPIDVTLFRDAAGYHAIQILAAAMFFSTLQAALTAGLQGVGAVYLPVFGLFAGTAVKIAANFVLVPGYGIDGAAGATLLSYAVAAWINWRALRRRLGLAFPWRAYIGTPLLASSVMCGFVFGISVQFERWRTPLPARLEAGLETVSCVAAGAVIYFIMLLLLGALTEGEIASLPRIGRPLASACRRVGLL